MHCFFFRHNILLGSETLWFFGWPVVPLFRKARAQFQFPACFDCFSPLVLLASSWFAFDWYRLFEVLEAPTRSNEKSFKGAWVGDAFRSMRHISRCWFCNIFRVGSQLEFLEGAENGKHSWTICSIDWTREVWQMVQMNLLFRSIIEFLWRRFSASLHAQFH